MHLNVFIHIVVFLFFVYLHFGFHVGMYEKCIFHCTTLHYATVQMEKEESF